VAEEDDPKEHSEDANEDAKEPEIVVAPPPVEDGERREAHPSEGLQIQATVTSVETVSADAVPDEYPISVTTDEVVEVTLEISGLDDILIALYFESPLRGVDDRLAQLLMLARIPPDALDRLEGQSILLTVEDGFYMPVLPDEPPRGTGKAVFGIFLGLFPSILIGLVGIFRPGAEFISSSPFVLAWFFATFMILPVSIYFDALNLRSTTNWEGTPRRWTVLSAIPGFNVLVIPLYLIARENAEPIV